ncbi:MAG: ACT domain-containing protein [Actinomycetota bacterium]|nr:ACT domain-containing protein [Actinomycetota bacterium]
MLALIRISVPDRPGALGDVASRIGAAGADILQVQVLESEAGRALDDVHVRVRDADHLERVKQQLAAISGVQVVGVRDEPAPTTGHGELELARRMVAAPTRALQTLVDGVSASTGSDWAAIVRFDLNERVDQILATSPGCPGPEHVQIEVPLRLSVIGGTHAGMALVPLTGTRLGLVVVRESGPPYHQAELWRLEQVGALAGNVLRQNQPASSELEVTA